MDLGLADAVVWVTGASGGIGRAVAEAFAAEGARLALHAGSRADELERWIARQPWAERALAVPGDVRREDEVRAAAERVLERFGRIDVAVANAGVWPPESLLLDEIPAERLQDTIQVNLFGALHTARAFLAALRRTGPRADGRGAALVFTGSTAGGFGERGHADYAVSKGALVALVRTLKNEIVRLDPYGRVNLVQPGWTVTHMARPALDDDETVRRVTRTMALRQLGRARDVARAILWLASPSASRHTSGEVLTVAGGMEGRLLWDEGEVDLAEVRRRLGDPEG